MEMPSTSDVLVIATVIIIAVVLAVVVVLLFVERKKITQVSINNADDDIYPLIAIQTANTASLEDQTFTTTLGKVLVSASETKVKADTKSAVVIQVLDGPATFVSTAGAAVNFKIYNKTENPIHVNGGYIGNGMNAGLTDFAYDKHLIGSVKAATVPANGSSTTIFSVSGKAAADINEFTFQLGLSVVKAQEAET